MIDTSRPDLINMYIIFVLLHRFALAERCWYADPDLRPSFNTLATEISNMIPDYDPNQYVEIARYSPYCQMYSDSSTLEKKDSENQSDSTKNDS